MRILPNKNRFPALTIILGGLVFLAPLFAQLIDMTDGICSHRFLQSAEAAAKIYYNDMGVPDALPELIDSSYSNRDQISAILYVYLAHLDKGMYRTYNADLARILSSGNCFHVAESLFETHLSINPDDYRAIGDYAILLAKRNAFAKSNELLRDAIKRAPVNAKRAIYDDFGVVLTLEHLTTGDSKTLDKAFEAFRLAYTGTASPPNDINAAKLWLNFTEVRSVENWQHFYTVKVGHVLGSDAIILAVKSNVTFGREIETSVVLDDIEELRELFGSIYIAPGESLVSKSGALEIVSDMGRFSPFYKGEAMFNVRALFPEGGTGVFYAGSPVILGSETALSPYYDALAYGEYFLAESVLTAISRSPDGEAKLPLRWKESIRLSQIIEDSTLWEYGLEYIDSLLNNEIDPNLWVYKGVLFYLLQNPDEAKIQFERAIAADPRNFWAVYNLALVEYNLGNKLKAAELFLNTREVNNRMYLANLLAGVIYEELGMIDKALLNYEIAFRNIAFRNEEISEWIEKLRGD